MRQTGVPPEATQRRSWGRPHRRRNAAVRLPRPARQPRGARDAAALRGFVFRLGSGRESGLCDTPTWAPMAAGGRKFGLDDAGIRDVNRCVIAFARDLRGAHPWHDHILTATAQRRKGSKW